ncbi:MAG: TonB family protein [Bacteroidota bacterium]
MDKIKSSFPFCTFILLQLILSGSLFAQNGIVKTYFPTGEVQEELSYANNILEGNSVWYYQNGNIMTEKNYDNGILNGWVKEYFDSGLVKEEYEVRDEIKDGIDRAYFENGGLKHIYYFSKGMITKQENFSFDPNYSAPAQNYLAGKRNQAVGAVQNLSPCDVEVCAAPIGGIKAVEDNLVYPEHALKYGLEGTVTLKAAINAEGIVTKAEVVKGIGLGCDEAAQTAVVKTKFHPGQNSGKPVDSTLMLNVDFKIFQNK